MKNTIESGLRDVFDFIAAKAKDIFSFLKVHSEPYVEQGTRKIEPVILRSKQFYQEHKEIVLIVGAVSLTYLIMRPRSKEEDKNKKKKGVLMKSKLNKSFISDDSGEEFRDEPSTTVRVESSSKQVLKKKNIEKRMMEKIQSSSESQEGDKIFFEMYQNYKNQISQR